MDRADGIQHFLEKEVQKLTECFRESLADYVNSHTADIMQELQSSFVQAYKKAEQQEKAERIAYIQFTQSRCDALLRQPFYRVELFDKSLYKDGLLCDSPLETEWMYRIFFQYCDALAGQAKKYISQIDAVCLERVQFTGLATCRRLMEYLLNRAIKDISQTEEYKKLRDRTAFYISSYRSDFSVVYVKDNRMDWWREMLNGILQD